MRLITYDDMIQHAIDYLGGNPGADASRDGRRAVLNALREFSTSRRWSYYYTHGRIVSNPPQTTGTITYQQSAGAQPRLVTLAGATWPSYAGQGSLVIGQIPYEVASRLSDTQLTLKRATNPGSDLATPTTYTLYQDTYPLPVDFLAADRLILQNNAFALWYEHPGVWLERQRIFNSPAIPRTYTFTGSQNYLGSMVVRFFPPPDGRYCFDYIYQRIPRPVRHEAVNAGTLSTVSGSTTVTGVGTAWTSAMAGAVLRVSSDTLNVPTSYVGSYPPYYERVVVSVESATSLTIDVAVEQTVTGRKYQISDPIDIENGAMLTAFQRCVELQIAMSRRMKDAGSTRAMYDQAVILAMEGDNRNFAAEVVGPTHSYPYRLAQMPSGADVS